VGARWVSGYSVYQGLWNFVAIGIKPPTIRTASGTLQTGEGMFTAPGTQCPHVVGLLARELCKNQWRPRSKRRRYRCMFAKASAAAVLLMVSFGASPSWAQQPADDSIVHGTINVALGNENGIVVLTDSMLTSDGHQLDTPGQKLFKLDEQTVCAIAGFVSAPAVLPDLSTQTDSVIREYVEVSKSLPPQSLAERLRNLAYIFEGYLNLISNTRLGSTPTTPLAAYELQIIVAGYDLDGRPGIGKIDLKLRWFLDTLQPTVEEEPIANISDGLTRKLNGIRDVADGLLQHPETAPQDPDLSAYKDSLHSNGGSSLTVEQMVALAKRLAYYTALKYREVGGDNQIAVLTGPHSLKIEQAHFPAPPLPLVNFRPELEALFADNVGKLPRLANHTIFIRCSFSGMEQVQELDGNFFIENQFRNTVLTYNGGKVGFDRSNLVRDSILIVGPLVRPDDERVQKLGHDFKWARILRDFSTGPVDFY
jgi:hypothetical protein